MIFRSWLYMLLLQLWENRTLIAPYSHQSSHLMHQISPNAKMRSRFMILCQPSLNGLPFILSPPLLYKAPILHSKAHKNPHLFSSLEFQEVEQSCHILVFLRLKVLSVTHSPSPNSSFPPPLEPPTKVSSSTIWILYEGIISQWRGLSQWRLHWDIEGYASIRLWWPTMSSFVYLFLYIICLICHYIAWHASFA